jgi:AGCS family alanine or glycine:cation symporter
MDQIEALLNQLNGMVWGPPMLIVLGAVGLYLSFGLRFLPWRKIPYAFKLLASSEAGARGEIPPFQALMTAMSATIGTGNIAGVATAIALGGPGAVFYMWLIALVGMSTKYAEAVCAVYFRETDASGQYVGGPMYYLKNGVGERYPRLGKGLAVSFAIFGAIAAFGIGNGTQIHSMADVLNNDFQVPKMLTGAVVAVLVGFVVLGGVTRIGSLAGKLVPAMVVLYIGGAITVITINASAVPAAFELIISSAFNPVAAAGGFTGAAVAAAIRFGVARGVFSNESGLGSAAIAHGAARTNSPVRQGHIAMLGTFIDTIVICTLTALCIITSEAWMSGENGAPLTALAFGSSFSGGNYVVTIALAVFAFTTIIGWSYYGERCWQYLLGERSVIVYRVFWVLAVFLFSSVKIDFIWTLSDTLNGLMAVPNLIGLIILGPLVFRLTREYKQEST